jgi:hypothetical protein
VHYNVWLFPLTSFYFTFSHAVMTDAALVRGELHWEGCAIPDGVFVHQGFRNAQALSAPIILEAVKKLMKLKNTKDVTIVSI